VWDWAQAARVGRDAPFVMLGFTPAQQGPPSSPLHPERAGVLSSATEVALGTEPWCRAG